jgi:uncharacterized protein (DUF2062 family)
MPRKLLHQYLPTPADLRKHPALSPLGILLQNPEIWHLHRRSVAGAAFIGLFCAFLPVPFQMLIAGGLAVVSRCNLPIAVALVWVTNPVTVGPVFFFAYKLGAWLLNMEIQVSRIQLSWSWLRQNLPAIGYPLLFGSLVCGWVAGVTAFVLVRVGWRLHVISRWRERRALRKARKSSPPAGAAEIQLTKK